MEISNHHSQVYDLAQDIHTKTTSDTASIHHTGIKTCQSMNKVDSQLINSLQDF
jgi:hypothetical protein